MRAKLSRTKVLNKILATDKPYIVTFTKKDGTKRKMIAKQGVEHNLKGGANRVVRDDNAYLTTWSILDEGYRTINLDTVRKLEVDGIKYKVV